MLLTAITQSFVLNVTGFLDSIWKGVAQFRLRQYAQSQLKTLEKHTKYI